VKQIVSEQGWKGLTGTIEPDIILMDEKGVIVRVYDHERALEGLVTERPL
jgi:hypothetical protein